MVRDEDSAKERSSFFSLFFFFFLPARANVNAALEHCSESELSRRLSLYLRLPQPCEALLKSFQVLSFFCSFFLPFHFPLSCSHSCCPRGFQTTWGGGSVLRDPEENMNIRYPLFVVEQIKSSMPFIPLSFFFFTCFSIFVLCQHVPLYSVSIAVLSGFPLLS